MHEFIFICLSRTPSVQHLYERTILHSTCTRNPTKSTDFRILHKEVNIKKINLFFYHKNLTELNLEEVETNGKKQWRRKQPKKKIVPKNCLYQCAAHVRTFTQRWVTNTNWIQKSKSPRNVGLKRRTRRCLCANNGVIWLDFGWFGVRVKSASKRRVNCDSFGAAWAQPDHFEYISYRLHTLRFGFRLLLFFFSVHVVVYCIAPPLTTQPIHNTFNVELVMSFDWLVYFIHDRKRSMLV